MLKVFLCRRSDREGARVRFLQWLLCTVDTDEVVGAGVEVHAYEGFGGKVPRG